MKEIETICIFGDSITWGAYDPENGGWATSLRNHFESQGQKITVYNCGVSGDTTGDLLKRLNAEAEAREPDLIIFAIGVNDSQYTKTRENSKVSTGDFKTNLEKLVGEAKGFTNNIVFVGINNVDESKVSPIPWGRKDRIYDNENVEIYNNLIKEIGEKENLSFIDLGDTITLEDLHDGLHPNSVGHKKIFVKVKDSLNLS